MDSPTLFEGYAFNPQTVNRYAYCVNNPVMYADPSGETVKALFGNIAEAGKRLVGGVVSSVNALVGEAKRGIASAQAASNGQTLTTTQRNTIDKQRSDKKVLASAKGAAQTGGVEKACTKADYGFATLSHGTDTELRFENYRLGGEELAPAFKHDPGFPYNPNAVSTKKDRWEWTKWGVMAVASQAVPWLPDASKAYRHYRDNSGEPMEVDYSRAYQEDEYIRQQIDLQIETMKEAAIYFHQNDGGEAFEMISDRIAIRNGTSENWQKTIGAHQVYGHGVVFVDSVAGIISIEATFRMEDMYNFNPGMKDIATGISDAVNGRFQELGWASEFITYGSLTQYVEVELFPKTAPETDQNTGGER